MLDMFYMHDMFVMTTHVITSNPVENVWNSVSYNISHVGAEQGRPASCVASIRAC